MKDRKNLVSVVIPAYNIEAYIAQCVESVRNQTYPEMEIIIVDDGSTDGTGRYCDEAAALDSRITALHQENQGVVSARDAGIRLARGKYMAFVDGDDWIDPDMIEDLVKQIGDADMAGVGVYQEQLPDRIIERTDQFKPGVYEGEALNHIYGKMIYDEKTGKLQPMTSWIYNKLYISSKVKEIHQKVGRELTFAEDSVFLYQYMLECKSIVISHKCRYHYRYREGSAVHARNEHMLADINKVYLALLEVFKGHEMGQEMLFQLQKWVTIRACIAVNEMMGFDERIHIPEFVADIKLLEDKKIVLYGAGRVGQDAYRQLREFGYDVVLWADRDFLRCQARGLKVQGPEEIKKRVYDVVFIAIEDEGTAEEIRKSLAEMGVPKEAVLWRKPMKLY